VKKVTTKCPSCGTSFRVTPQLAARHGQVRCGHCNTLFNGLETLAMGATPPVEIERDREDRATQPAAREAQRTYESPADDRSPRREDDEAPVLYHPDFTPGRGNPKLWLGGSAFLLLLLLAQGMIYFRDGIARDMPRFKPFLNAYCSVIGCRVNLPRDADLITIESSDLKQIPERPNEITLAALLRNRAGFAQAYPTLELTLTDAADQAIVKRLIPPSDYITEGARIEQGISPLEEVNVRLRMQTQDVNPVGYRLFVFYP
jgi:predicted Zn finger-like uncharacterized protein